MNNKEIKEILEEINKFPYGKYYGLKQEQANQIKQLLDYITNIQQENEKLKYNARGQVNDYFKDKYADEVLKKVDLIKDFELTCYKNYELTQEINRLNNIINELEKELLRKLEAVKSLKDTLGDNVYVLNPHIDLLETEYNYFLNKLKELKESGNNEMD